MAEIDKLAKDYLMDTGVAADIINNTIFGGERVVSPKNLKPFHTTQIFVDEKGNENSKTEERFRDNLSMLTDGKTVYALVGIEEQTNVHYAMPARVMNYDAMSYMYQVEHGEDGVKRNSYPKSGKLIPVITVVVHLGVDRWNAPRSLYECFGDIDERIKKYVPDYEMNLLSPCEMTDEQIEHFQTDFGLVLNLLSKGNDKDALNDVFETDERYQNMPGRAARLANRLLGFGIQGITGEEETNMCKAWAEMLQDREKKGIEQGFDQGVDVGEKKLIEKMKSMSSKELKEFLKQSGVDLEPEESLGYSYYNGSSRGR